MCSTSLYEEPDKSIEVNLSEIVDDMVETISEMY